MVRVVKVVRVVRVVVEQCWGGAPARYLLLSYNRAKRSDCALYAPGGSLLAPTSQPRDLAERAIELSAPGAQAISADTAVEGHGIGGWRG